MCYYKTLQLLGAGAETVKTLYAYFDSVPQNRHISVCGEHTVLIYVCPKRLHRLLYPPLSKSQLKKNVCILELASKYTS